MKSKRILFLVAMLFYVFFVNSQIKYNYIQVHYWNGNLYTSTDGEEFKVESISDKPKLSLVEKSMYFNPLLKKITELEDAGWELSGRELNIAYMRKKR